MITTDIVQSGRVPSGDVRNGTFFELVGVIFAVLEATQLHYPGPQGVFLIVVSCLPVCASVATVLEARRFR